MGTYQKGKKLVAIDKSESEPADIEVFGTAWGPAFNPLGLGAVLRRTVGGLIPRELLVASLTVGRWEGTKSFSDLGEKGYINEDGDKTR